MIENKKFYDLDELEKEVFQGKISRTLIYKMCKRGDIPTISIGKRLLVPAWWVNKLINEPQGA